MGFGRASLFRFVRKLATAAGILSALVQGGCISYSTFQSPKTLEPGQTAMGIGGLAAVADGVSPMEGNLYARLGLGENVDGGIKLWGPLGFGIQSDVKVQLTDAAPLVAASLGGSVNLTGTVSLFDERIGPWTIVGVHPMVLVGSENAWVGVKGVFTKWLGEGESYSDFFPGIAVGCTGSGPVQVMPEVNVYFSFEEETSTFATFGLAIQTVSGGR